MHSEVELFPYNPLFLPRNDSFLVQTDLYNEGGR